MSVSAKKWEFKAKRVSSCGGSHAIYDRIVSGSEKTPMGDMVIVAYRPKPGRAEDLLALTRNHVSELRRLGLATDRPALAMRSTDGIIVEVFEWRDGAIDAAHAHPDVLAMWERYGAVCDYVPLQHLPEGRDMFARFEPVDLT